MLDHYRNQVDPHVGDATDLRTSVGAADSTYDAGFDFAINHHIPAWQTNFAEIARILRPGGRFYFDQVTTHALARPTYRALFDHPTDNRSHWSGFDA